MGIEIIFKGFVLIEDVGIVKINFPLFVDLLKISEGEGHGRVSVGDLIIVGHLEGSGRPLVPVVRVSHSDDYVNQTS